MREHEKRGYTHRAVRARGIPELKRQRGEARVALEPLPLPVLTPGAPACCGACGGELRVSRWVRREHAL